MARTLGQILATENPEVVAKAREKATEMLLDPGSPTAALYPDSMESKVYSYLSRQ